MGDTAFQEYRLDPDKAFRLQVGGSAYKNAEIALRDSCIINAFAAATAFFNMRLGSEANKKHTTCKQKNITFCLHFFSKIRFYLSRGYCIIRHSTDVPYNTGGQYGQESDNGELPSSFKRQVYADQRE